MLTALIETQHTSATTLNVLEVKTHLPEKIITEITFATTTRKPLGALGAQTERDTYISIGDAKSVSDVSVLGYNIVRLAAVGKRWTDPGGIGKRR